MVHVFDSVLGQKTSLGVSVRYCQTAGILVSKAVSKSSSQICWPAWVLRHVL